MATLRFGIVGAGFITRFQTVAMKQVRGLEFAGITQHRGSAAVVKLAKEIGTGEPRIYPSLGEMAQHVEQIEADILEPQARAYLDFWGIALRRKSLLALGLVVGLVPRINTCSPTVRPIGSPWLFEPPEVGVGLFISVVADWRAPASKASTFIFSCSFCSRRSCRDSIMCCAHGGGGVEASDWKFCWFDIIIVRVLVLVRRQEATEERDGTGAAVPRASQRRLTGAR